MLVLSLSVHDLKLQVLLQGETLFRTVIDVTGGGGAAGGSSGSSEAAVRTALEDYMTRLPEPLNMVEVLPKHSQHLPVVTLYHQQHS